MKDASANSLLDNSTSSLIVFLALLTLATVLVPLAIAFSILAPVFVLEKIYLFILNTALLILTAFDIGYEFPYKALAWLRADVDLSVKRTEEYGLSSLLIPMHVADKYNKVNAMRALINASRNINALRYDAPYPMVDKRIAAIHVAVLKGNNRMINMLIEAKANMQLRAVDKNSNIFGCETPLYLALGSGNAELAWRLFEYANKDDLLRATMFAFWCRPEVVSVILTMMLKKGLSMEVDKVFVPIELISEKGPLYIVLGFKLCEAWKGLQPEQFLSMTKYSDALAADTQKTWGDLGVKAGLELLPDSLEAKAFDGLNLEGQTKVIKHALEFSSIFFSLPQNFFCTSVFEARECVKELLKFLGITRCVCKDFQGASKMEGALYVEVFLPNVFQMSVLAVKTTCYLSNDADSAHDIIVKNAVEISHDKLKQQFSLLEAKAQAVVSAFTSV